MIEDLKTMQANCPTCPYPDYIKDELCYVCATQQAMKGKWKLLIIFLLKDGPQRFSELQRSIPNIKHGPLTSQLKELTESGLIDRFSYNEVPPKVEYSLTEKGKDFSNVINVMTSWAKKHIVK